MVHMIPFEHYVMDGKKRKEPESSEWQVTNDALIVESKFEAYQPDETPLSVLQTPWGRFAHKTEMFTLESHHKVVTIIHTLTSSKTDDNEADWWKG